MFNLQLKHIVKTSHYMSCNSLSNSEIINYEEKVL